MSERKQFVLRRGTLIDASIIKAARRPKKRKEDKKDNSKNKEEGSAQQDYDATLLRWGKHAYYCYKAHIGVDLGSGIIRKSSFTTASLHDSQEFDELVCGDEASVFADKAYADSARKQRLRRRSCRTGICSF